MDKFQNIENFYDIILTLEDIKRQGWVIRNVPAERLESVSDHTLQVLMLAVTLKRELNLDFRIEDLAQMAFIHDIGEAKIGDIAAVDPEYREKKKNELDAVKDLLSSLSEDTQITYLEYWLEVETKASKSGRFLYEVDKLDGILKSKHYARKYNMPELYVEFYETEKAKGTFDGSVIEEVFNSLDPKIEQNKEKNSR